MSALRTREIMRAEGCLVSIALENIVYGTFEVDWARDALDQGVKEEYVLEGLYRGACFAPRDNDRISCPEMTIKGLVGDGEYNLIRMLKRIIGHDPTGNGRVKSPFLFSHPYAEHELRHTPNASDLLKANLYHNKLCRGFYIVETLIGILKGYNNRPAKTVKPARFLDMLRTKEQAQNRRNYTAHFKKSGYYVDTSQCEEEAAIMVYACYSCHAIKDRDSFKRCGSCLLVRYCSSECQKKHWPDHKKFCGKTIFDPALVAPSSKAPDFIGCPAPVDGFVRTPALWRQIEFLGDSLTRDYHVSALSQYEPHANAPFMGIQFETAVGHSRCLRVTEPPGAHIVFLVAHRRAMTSGSLPAINMMHTILCYQTAIGLSRIPVQMIRSQLQTEYRVKIDDKGVVGAGAFAPSRRKS
ncbi:hypothetical protein DFH06DRAFT_1479568 [Mycena polygramma]|nr:hypothetical protein DFH06DRAFT_1479568 [Mycena polygramma]